MKKYEISEKWIKASIVGTIWAASEIVLGSFLHNLKFPFSGNILTAIAIIILISISYVWKEKGLFWRAGLICALMKTISPSAVIFGPMIAIFFESVLIELSVRLFGRTFFGFALGAMLAMSWNLVQKIANFLIFYGFNIVRLYEDLIKLVQKQLNIQTDILWLPLIVLLIIYSLLGLLSAIVGIRIGHKLLNQPKNTDIITFTQPVASTKNKAKHEFRHSLVWLFADMIILFFALALLNYTQMIYWSLFISIAVVVWSLRYQRALRQLTKPRFWVFFVSITMITAFVFTKVQNQSWQEGLLIGLQMNFRAVIVILGFSVLGTEMYNPRIRAFFLKTSFKQLPSALELSFESLPLMIANIPDFKTVIKNPVSVIYQIILQAENRLNEIRSMMNSSPKVYIVTGEVGEGKSTFAQIVAKELIEGKQKVGGFLSLRLTEGKETIGYDILDISSNQSKRFLRLGNDASPDRIGRFAIYPEGLQKGQQALENCMISEQTLIIIDEVGKLELQGKGWANSLKKLLNASPDTLLITVRHGLEFEVIEKFQITEYEIIHVGLSSPLRVAERILDKQTSKEFHTTKL